MQFKFKAKEKLLVKFFFPAVLYEIKSIDLL